jgi:hypothetical protein
MYPLPLPHDYEGPGGIYAEPTGGLLPTTPLVLLLLLLPFRWRRRPQERSALAVVAGLTTVGLGIMLLLAYGVPGTTERYEVDYSSLFGIAAVVMAALVLADLSRRTLRRRVAVTVGAAATAFASIIGIALGLQGYGNLLDVNHPALFNTLEDITSPLATLATEVVGKPVIARVISPLPVTLPPRTLTTFDQGGAGTALGDGSVELVVIAPSSERTTLDAKTSWAPGIAPNPTVRIQVRSADGTLTTTPVTKEVRLPIKLNLGLNRIAIDLAGPVPATASPAKLYLGSMGLGS